MRVHPACEVFPLLDGQEFADLVEDIRANGQREKIILDEDGRVLDGRNRYRACRELKLEPRTSVWRPRNGDSVIALVVSLNIKRRHLTPSLRASLSEDLEPMFAAEAKERQRAAGRDHGRGQAEKSARKADEQAEKVTQKVEEPIDKSAGMAATQAAKATGANRQYVADMKMLRKEAPDLHERVKKSALSIPKAKAALKTRKKAQVAERIRNEPKPLPDGPFRVIVADPPWQYANRADDDTHRSRNPYPDMTVEAICALREDVVPRAADDAVLWLWTTNAFMPDAFKVLDAWGFQHKTILTWVKDQMGMGDWLRGKTEHCLLAVRGKPVVTLTNQTTVLIANRGRHSEKPAEFYALVESLCPGAKLEIFARTKREGWQTWGGEAPDQ